MTFEEILTKAKALPLDQRKALIHDLVETIAPQSSEPVTKRVFGLTKGTFLMSEDFDEELPDVFWLGDDA